MYHQAGISEFKNEKDVITYYFKQNFTYKVIVMFLRVYHDINVSVRTLKRRLSDYGLKRRGNVVTDDTLKHLIEQEIQGPSSMKGYRCMWNTLRCRYGIITPRDRVMKLLRELDPEGTEIRKARRLHRRTSISQGPNTCWHVDGYDKLKPYGLPIHGCIDGFSRKLIWLKVAKSNNNPLIPAFLLVSNVN